MFKKWFVVNIMIVISLSMSGVCLAQTPFYGIRQIDPDYVDIALKQDLPFFDHKKHKGRTQPPSLRAYAYFILVLDYYLGNAGNSDVILHRTRHLIKGGNEPTCAGNLNSRGYNPAIAALAMMKKTNLWAELSELEKTKVTFIMQSCLAASAIVSDDRYKFHTGLDGQGRFKKTYASNYREGFMGSFLSSTFFLGIEDAHNFLESFDAQQHIKNAKSLGMHNLVKTFSVEKGTPVKDINIEEMNETTKDYRYQGLTIFQIDELYEYLVNKSFIHPIACGKWGWGKGLGPVRVPRHARIAKGCDTLPNKGMIGMVDEFDAGNPESTRSSLSYVFHTLRNVLINMAVQRIYGYPLKNEKLYWQRHRGFIDFLYKYEKGYYSVSQIENTVLQKRNPDDNKPFQLLPEGLWAALKP